MSFHIEPTHYIRGILADLQGAWSCLRQAIVEEAPREIMQRLLFHTDEGLSWESVRNLDKMKNALVLIQNIITQHPVNEEIVYWVDDVQEILAEVCSAIKQGAIL